MTSHSPRKRKNQEESDEEEPDAKTCKYTASEFRSQLKGPDPIEGFVNIILYFLSWWILK